MRVLITGGAGFIGSAVVRAALNAGHEVTVVDALTYAGGRDNLPDDPRCALIVADVADANRMAEVMDDTAPQAVLHLAAETHVDRSIDGPAAFVRTNVGGVSALLEAVRARQVRTGEMVRFVNVSTDEVFGVAADESAFTETTPYQPNSPYAATKAGADHLVRAWAATYGLAAIITNCSNNYGPRQYPEKLIPVVIANALGGAPIPLYGDGRQVRDWLYVDDHADALLTAMERGAPGETYLIGARRPVENVELVTRICALLDEAHPRPDAAPYAQQITHVQDRPAHDRRYAVDPSKIERDLGWRARTDLDAGLRATVRWYLDNETWVKSRLGDALPPRLGDLSPADTR